MIVHLVPHTHWDREWYLPWQLFRMRLVELVDGLLDEMAVDDRVRFTLDGQTATVDDYLEIRPHRESELRALVSAGRLAVGPWRILMDEFLVSGETHVRNLEMGVRRATDLGRVMAVGYLPDMFGHIAQMPQILRRAGIEDAVVWRGVPAEIDRHAFAWSAPDGSVVRCEYLLGGYGNGRDVLALADRIGRKLEVFVELQRAAFGDDDLLAMYGEDHSIPRAGYADLIAAFNASQDRYEIRVETLAEALAPTRDRSAPQQSWRGELRSSARANVLMGVTSHRIEVKQAAGRVERLLERTVEPLWALHGPGWPDALLAQAWRRVVENSAHDSICACSAEPTVAQVLVRYGEAEQIAAGLVDRLLLAVGSNVARGAFVAVNPSPTRRIDLVTLEVPLPVVGERPQIDVRDAEGHRLAVQDDGVAHLVVREATLVSSEVVPYLRRRMHARELYGYQVNGYRIVHGDGAHADHELTIDVALFPDPDDLDVDDLLDRLAADTALRPDEHWHVTILARPRQRLIVRADVPPLGWSAIRPTVAAAADDGPETAGGPDAPATAVEFPVRATDRGLSNDLVDVTVADDGTLSFRAAGVTLDGVGRIVDGGDVGDSYNYAPPPRDTVVDTPTRVATTVSRRGPLVGELVVRRMYDWPRGLTPDLLERTPETVTTPATTTVELRADEPFVRIRVEIENASVDHRVRFHVPLSGGARSSRAEGQFAIVQRGLTMEGGHGEVPLPTFPAHGFVIAGSVAALLEHVTEYELIVDEASPGGPDAAASELALTLIRATGLISRDNHPYREEPAGPVIAAPTGQAQGRRVVSFALLPLPGGSPTDDALVLAAAERYRYPFLVGAGSSHRAEGGAAVAASRLTGGAVIGGAVLGTAADEASTDPATAARAGLDISGDAVVLTSLRRRDDESRRSVLELRIVREADRAGSATLDGPFVRMRDVDLLGRPLGEWTDAPGHATVPLGAWEIRTLQLDPSEPTRSAVAGGGPDAG